jgi:broad specificity phosphatase PhoE
MGTLLLVRHGQASALADDYDRLSPVGERQARLWGEHWARRGLRVDRVFHGPRVRQRRSAEIAGAAFVEAGGTWPAPTELPTLDEMAGDRMLAHALPALVQEHGDVRRLAEAFEDATARRLAAGVATPGHELAEEALRAFDRLFQHVMRRWIEGQVEAGHLEPWAAFRERVRGALRVMRASATGSGQTIVAFTSAGPVAAAVGEALALDDGRTLDLMWQVKNASVSEFRFSGERFSLSSFNGTPHLAEPSLETLR